jgi:hypothetical protein
MARQGVIHGVAILWVWGACPERAASSVGVTSIVGLYDDAGKAFGAAGRNLVALGANVSRFAGPIGTALSAVQTASQLNNGQYVDAAFTTADFLLAAGLSLTGPLGVAADVGVNASGGTKAAARGAASLICNFGDGP